MVATSRTSEKLGATSAGCEAVPRDFRSPDTADRAPLLLCAGLLLMHCIRLCISGGRANVRLRVVGRLPLERTEQGLRHLLD
jgi:hypothetical protein